MRPVGDGLENGSTRGAPGAPTGGLGVPRFSKDRTPRSLLPMAFDVSALDARGAFGALGGGSVSSAFGAGGGAFGATGASTGGSGLWFVNVPGGSGVTSFVGVWADLLSWGTLLALSGGALLTPGGGGTGGANDNVNAGTAGPCVGGDEPR